VFEATPRTGSRAAPKTASRGCAASPPHRTRPSAKCPFSIVPPRGHRAPFGGLRVPRTASNWFPRCRRVVPP
jgi:hypothetical protein